MTTTRLQLRRLVAEDAPALYELDRDPEVRRYVHAGAPTPERIRDEILPRMQAAAEPDPQLGFWALDDRATGEFLGWICLRRIEADDADEDDTGEELEVGFRLRRAVWGRGLATEACRAVTARAFRRPGTKRLLAVTLVANRASQRVLEKTGFHRIEEFRHRPPPTAVLETADADRPAYRYLLTRTAWQAENVDESA